MLVAAKVEGLVADEATSFDCSSAGFGCAEDIVNERAGAEETKSNTRTGPRCGHNYVFFVLGPLLT